MAKGLCGGRCQKGGNWIDEMDFMFFCHESKLLLLVAVLDCTICKKILWFENESAVDYYWCDEFHYQLKNVLKIKQYILATLF